VELLHSSAIALQSDNLTSASIARRTCRGTSCRASLQTEKGIRVGGE
jgi:hypothetical protein